MSKTDRATGYYWTLHQGEWMIAHWWAAEGPWAGRWELVGSGDALSDDDFAEIDERRIERQP